MQIDTLNTERISLKDQIALLVPCNLDTTPLTIEHASVETWMKFLCAAETASIENEKKKNANAYKNNKNTVFVLMTV